MTVETDTDAAPRPLPSRASTGASVQESVTGVAPTIAFFFAIAALICMGELDRLIGAGLDSVRSSATLSQVQGPFSLTHLDAWATWHDSQLSAIATWIQFSIWCDFVFLAAYGWGLIVLSAQIRKSERPDWGPLVFAVLLVIIDAAENVFVLWLSGGLAEPDGNYEATGAVIVGVLATIKWILVVFTVISIARSPAFAEIAGPVIRRARHASYVHRLGLTMIIALAVLGLVPTGSIVFDQLPDVQRAWVDDGPLLVSGHAIVAALLIVLAAYGLWVVATAASDRDDEQTGRKPTSPHMWILIWVGVATLFVIGVIFQRTDWRLLPTLWLLIYLTVTMLLSYFLRSRTFEPLPDFDETHSAAARATGNLLPILLLGVGMLGLIRSFVGPTALVMVSDPSSDDRGGDIVWSFVLAAAGLLVVPLAAAILVTLGTRNDAIPGSRTHRTLQRITGPFGMSVASFVAIVLLAAFIVNPIGFARFFGVVGTAIVGLGSWAVLVGTAAAVIDSRHPLPLFRALRMRNTPILSVLLLVAFIGSTGGGDPRIHAIRTTEPSATPQPTIEAPQLGFTGSGYLDRAIAEWEARQKDGCGITVAVGDAAGAATIETRTVRPMILVAAEGGGIRAAYWTAHAMRTLASDLCLSSEVLLSSGVSGGSVGLVATRVLTDAAPADFTTKITALAQSDSLAAAAGGLLIGDLVTGVLGFRVGADDRAGLTERAWEATIPELEGAVDPISAEPTGALVLNSTDATTGCRVLVLPGMASSQKTGSGVEISPSQEDLSGVYRSGPEATSGAFIPDPARLLQEQCRHPQNAASTAVALDVLTSRACTSHMAWSTAAMLSARFTYVSPAGRLPAEGSCSSDVPVQLVDGGYAENTGLQQLADISPLISSYIARNNALVDVEPDRAFIVPLVVSIRNSVGQDVAAETSSAMSEILVPLAGRAALDVQASADAWMQRILTDFDSVCAADGIALPSCVAVQDLFSQQVRSGAVIVAPDIAPAIQPPLGWRLSNMSMESLCTALTKQSKVELPAILADSGSDSMPPPPGDGPPVGPDGAPLVPPTEIPPTKIPWPGFEDYADSLQSLFYLTLIRNDPDHDEVPGRSAADAPLPAVSCAH